MALVPRPSTTARILLVDPDAMFLAQLADRIGALGIEVMTASNATRATEAIATYEFDLIVSESMMPGKSGWQLREAAMQRPESALTPFAILATILVDDDRARAERLGIRHLLRKVDGLAKPLELARAVIPAYVGGRRPKPRPPDEQRARLESLLQKVGTLGMRGHLLADGLALEADVEFQRLYHAFTGIRIPGAQVKNYGTSRLAITAPRHLSWLAPIPVLEMKSHEEYEQAVGQAYERHTKAVNESRRILERMKIPYDRDDPGFRLVGRLRVGYVDLQIVLRDPRTVEVIGMTGASLDGVERSAKIASIGQASSATELEILLEPVVDRLREAASRVARESLTTAGRMRISAADEPPPLFVGSIADDAPQGPNADSDSEFEPDSVSGVFLGEIPADEPSFADASRSRDELFDRAGVDLSDPGDFDEGLDVAHPAARAAVAVAASSPAPEPRRPSKSKANVVNVKVEETGEFRAAARPVPTQLSAAPPADPAADASDTLPSIPVQTLMGEAPIAAPAPAIEAGSDRTEPALHIRTILGSPIAPPEEADPVARVCQKCGGLYLVVSVATEPRLETTCPKCLGLT